ncbi:MAG TPA: alpha-ketoglutarate-dependent dioxygenase AlkB [Actinomycetota bacterium]|nr:alpha-ketoglutarate-dependent dioxygenase AlkB [Actinomycetota bacterium]
MASKTPDLSWQPSLFGADAPAFDASFARLERIQLDPTAWVEYAPGWLEGSDLVFEEILEKRNWGQRSRKMYDQKVVEPRLTAPWNLRSGEPLEPPILEAIRVALSDRYGIVFDSVGFNLYRDGRDSVAWHGDRIKKEIEDPIVVLVSLGFPRKFLLRPVEGGRSKAFMLGAGDLLVTGGKTQRTWQHSVPKVAQAGPRISLAYRHGMDPNAYKHKQLVERDES